MSSITVTTHCEAQPGQRELLNEVLWGSPGGLRYQLLDGTAWTRLPASSRFLLAHRNNEVVGCYVLAPQSWGVLRLLLAVRPGEQGSGIGRALVESVAEGSSQEVLAGTIEKTNTRSLQLSVDAGYKTVADLEVRTFTRQRPSLHSVLRFAAEEELPQIARHLDSQEHDWFSAEHLRSTELIVTPDLSAGVQLCIHTWRIASLGLPGPFDALARSGLPLVGIHPSRFRFATGHYWWGDPVEWNRLLEHGLASLNLQGIVLTGDSSSTIWKDLRDRVEIGMIGKTMGGEEMVVTSNHPLKRPICFTPLNAV